MFKKNYTRATNLSFASMALIFGILLSRFTEKKLLANGPFQDFCDNEIDMRQTCPPPQQGSQIVDPAGFTGDEYPACADTNTQRYKSEICCTYALRDHKCSYVTPTGEGNAVTFTTVISGYQAFLRNSQVQYSCDDGVCRQRSYSMS